MSAVRPRSPNVSSRSLLPIRLEGPEWSRTVCGRSIRYTAPLGRVRTSMTCDPTGECAHMKEDHGCCESWQVLALRRGEELDEAMQKVVSALDAGGFVGKEGFAVRLAVEEAIVNGLKHGHGYD